jgi:hypothetical protein
MLLWGFLTIFYQSIRPSLEAAVSFLVQNVQRYPLEKCQICAQVLFLRINYGQVSVVDLDPLNPYCTFFWPPGSESVIICTDPDPSINKQKNLDFNYFF